jgi:hypothetical protein
VSLKLEAGELVATSLDCALQFNLTDCAGPLSQAMTGGAELTLAVVTCSWPHALQAAPPVAAP